MKKTAFVYPTEFLKWADGMLDGEIWNKCQNGYWLLCFLVPHIYTDPEKRKWGLFQKYKKAVLSVKIEIARTVEKYADSASKTVIDEYSRGIIKTIDYTPQRKTLAGNYADYTVMAMTSADYLEGCALLANMSIYENEGIDATRKHELLLADIVRQNFKK